MEEAEGAGLAAEAGEEREGLVGWWSACIGADASVIFCLRGGIARTILRREEPAGEG